MEDKKQPNLRRRLQEKFKSYDKLDKQLTEKLAVCANKSSLHGDWRSYMIALEYSCHGIIWLALCFVVLWFSSSETSQQVVVNLLTALILDLVFVAVIKALVRRGRPANNRNDMFFTISIDNYAFPSGHASRSVLLAIIFYVKGVGGFLVSYLTIAWSATICISRILLGRHHVGDVLAGVLLGLFEAGFMLLVWFSVDTSQSILKTFAMFQTFLGADDADLI